MFQTFAVSARYSHSEAEHRVKNFAKLVKLSKLHNRPINFTR